jgi:hypothetical protein
MKMRKRRVEKGIQGAFVKKDATHDCAFLEPLAFPPDLPPVILIDLDFFGKRWV